MSDPSARPLDLDDDTPGQPARLSANAHWLFGSLYALMALVGFGFGVWAGAHKPRPVVVADAKTKDAGEKPSDKPPVVVPPTVTPPPGPVVVPPEPRPTEPKPQEPEPKPVVKEPEPKPKEPEPKPKDPPKPPEVKPVAFKEVVPILRAYCFDCHGASAGKPKGGVDLTTLARIRDSKNMPLVPGRPKESGLYTSVVNGDMPPDGKRGPTPEELKVLHDWIAGGAKERRRVVRGRRKVELTRSGGAG